MGPQTLAEYLTALSPIVWLCIGAIILTIVLVKTLILPRDA